jgi:methylamine dehydrogenase accessory protein MauD
MWVAILIFRLALALVFVIAGVAKLLDLSGSRQALTDFGVPRFLASWFGTVLPMVEVAIGLAILSGVWTHWGSIAGLLLLLIFIAAISINLLLGRRPHCHCFGQLHSEALSPSTLMRNLILAILAALLVWQGRQNPPADFVSWIVHFSRPQLLIAIGLLALILLGANVALLWQVILQQGRMLVRIEGIANSLPGVQPLAPTPRKTSPAPGLAVGTAAPDFRLPDLDGQLVALNTLLALARPTLLLFTNPKCGPCQALLAEIASWQRELRNLITVVVVSEGSVEENRTKSSAHGVSQILLQKKREVAESYQAWGTPAAVILRPDGRIGSALANGADAIRSLVPPRPSNLNAVAHPPDVRIGESPPATTLLDLRGQNISLDRFRDREVLLLFWNPNCGFCQRMLPELRKRDAGVTMKLPELVVVSSGTKQEGEAMGLQISVLLDPQTKLGHALGAHGTPMAVLLDTEGRVASQPVAGADAILELLDKRYAAFAA